MLQCSIFEQVFRHLDDNCDGKISVAELQKYCTQTVGEDLSPDDIESLVSISDSNGDGLLEFDDFMRLFDYVEEGEEEWRSMKEAFRVYEMDRRGYITAESLREVLGRLGESRSVGDCKAMIREFDLNGDGVICFEEFRIMMM